MSPKHVMTSLVLFVTIATLHVSGEPSEGAKQSPICRQMCANVSALCQRDCHYSIGAQSNGTNHWEGSESNFIDQSKYRCINKCMDEDQAVMVSSGLLRLKRPRMEAIGTQTCPIANIQPSDQGVPHFPDPCMSPSQTNLRPGLSEQLYGSRPTPITPCIFSSLIPAT